jgi:capsular polysaccharide biosynthesis protein
MTFDPLRFRDGMGAVRIFERPALLMCGPTDASFGDWIINFPPRLALAEAAGLHDLSVVVRRDHQSQALDILAALGVGPDRIVLHDLEGVSLFPRLIVPSWPTPAKLAPSAGVYDVYRRVAARPPAGERPLLYLARRNQTSRRMANEDQVCALFERRGFRAVDPGSLSFAEVRELFANPACVAGPFGSAFHNLAFGAGKPINLVLLPDHTRHYLDEIALWHGDLGLRFGYLLGESLPDAGSDAGAKHAPWIAPLDRLDQAIDTILDLVAKQDQ